VLSRSLSTLPFTRKSPGQAAEGEEIVNVQCSIVIGACAIARPFQEKMREAPPQMTIDH
jgi:hypothetical protein